MTKRLKGGKFASDSTPDTSDAFEDVGTVSESFAFEGEQDYDGILPEEAPVAVAAPPAKPTEVPSATLNVRVRPAPNMEGNAIVRPLKDLKRVRIGKTWYSFKRGTPVRVPKEIVKHLQEKGII